MMPTTGTWNSGKLKGQMGTQWKTLVLSTGSGSQDIGYGAFFEEESASVEFTVKWLDLARVKVTKKDKNSKVNLSGAVFGIYSDSACKNLLVQMPATDSNGTSEVELPKTQDTVYLKEISVPEGYKLNTESFNVKLETGKTTSVAVTNEEQKGKITIRKKGEVLTGVTGEEGNLTFVYGNADFAGAEYNIYAAEDIYSQDKVTKVHKAGDLVESLTTGEDGSAVSKELYLGKYKVVEQKAPENLVIGKTEQERTQFVTLSYAGQNVELSQGETTFTNARPEISVNVVKKSKHDDVTLEGATFGLYAEEDLTAADGKVLVEKGSLVERAVSDREGMAVFHADIPLNFHYSVKEIQAPDKYYMTDEVYRFFYEYKDDSTYTYTFSHDFKNEEVRGEVHVSKIDQDSQGFISQGDATLVGAKYGLYAAEDIEHPNKKDGIVHKKGELVAQGTISSEGTVDFKNLYLGNYFVKEIEPAELLLQEVKMKEQYYREIEAGNKKVQEIKHDLKNRLIALYAIEKANVDFKKEFQKIIGELDEGEKTIYTANIIVNTILNNKLRNAQKRHIATEASVLVPKQMNLDYSAAGILLGNLLDNAIEACEKIEASKRWIAVNIIYKEHTLILKICNSKEIKKANIALSSKRHYKQSGIGIHSVTRVVEKYNGTIEFLDLGDSFEVSAVLYGILSEVEL